MVNVVLIGAGQRADIYSTYSLDNPSELNVVGIVDPDPVRRGIMAEKYSVSEENLFSNVEEFVKREKFADAVVNGTMDHLHVKTSVPVLEKGYDLLLEKPFAVNEQEVSTLLEVARRTGRKVVICHVLRYTPFYRAIKDCVLSGKIGKIISIEMCEHVNYHHMAVSYVRGKWRSEKLCHAPMLLAKSCHDIDILLWMMGGAEPVTVTSTGSDMQFGTERKPEGAGHTCMTDCPYVDECSFSAKTNYITRQRWSNYIWKSIESEGNVSIERKIESMKTDNPYGKCVWDFERDGNVDHQSVMITFSNGSIGTFSMVGGSAKSERNIHVVGTKGEIKGTFEDSKYVVRQIDPTVSGGYTEELFDLNVTGDMIGEKGGHGGGDHNLVKDFLEYINGGMPSVSCATLEDSKMSHLVVFKAEKSRKNQSVENV